MLNVVRWAGDNYQRGREKTAVCERGRHLSIIRERQAPVNQERGREKTAVCERGRHLSIIAEAERRQQCVRQAGT